MQRTSPTIIVVLLCLSIFGIFTSEVKAEQNLIINSGFENNLTGWSKSEGTTTYTADATTSHSGTYSVKGIETDTESLGRLYQDITGIVSLGDEYQIEGWIKTSSVIGSVVIAVDYVDQDGWTPPDGYVMDWIGDVSGTQDWAFFQSPTFTLPPMPSDAQALWFLLDFNNGAGTAWWDDVLLVHMQGVKGIETVVTLNAFNRETNKLPQILGADDAFSIQQNFGIYCGTEQLYWVQNIVYVWKSPITGLVGMAGETEVWGCLGDLVVPIDFSPGLGLITSIGRPSLIPKTLPATVVLRSTIDNNALVMKNDFWSHEFPVPTGSYISIEGASLPEIVLVGWSSTFDANVDFDSPTSGHVDTYARLGESGPWLRCDNIIVPYGSASTAETSSGLHWTAQGDFAYDVDSDDQGFWFPPHFEGPSLEPPGVSVSSTGGRAYIISARCPANISIYDSSGRHLGYNQNTGSMDQEIPWGILLQTNDTKLMIVYYCDNSYNLSLIGTGEGKAELEIGLMDEGGSVGILWNSSESVATSITIPYTITGTTVTPEFPSILIPSLFIIATLLALVLHKKRKHFIPRRERS